MKPKVLVCGGCGIANEEDKKQRHTTWCSWWIGASPYTRRWAW